MDLLPQAVPAIWRRFLDALRELDGPAWFLGLALCALMIAALPRWPERTHKHVRWVSLALLAVTATAGVLWAARLAWLSDDAFISFRYARNLVEGHGLVFNPGERVEGYTNFLWTLLMAAAVALHIHPGLAALVLGLASLAGCLVLAWRIAQATATRRSPPTLSIAAVLLAGSYLFASYGTSGLETMTGTVLVLLALDRALHRAPVMAGLAAVAAMLTRPDHAIFAAALGAALALDATRRKGLARYLLPIAAIYLPYFVARWAWYGELLPNTFYAKSGGESHVSQGVIYLLVCLLGGGWVGILPLATAGLVHLRRHLLIRFALLAIPLYLLYIVRIGGDFMFGRWLVPVVPLFAILAEAGARRLVAVGRPLWAAAGIAAASLAVLPIRLLPPTTKLWLIADERTFYPVTSLSPLHVDSPFSDWADQLLRIYGPGPDSPRLATGCVGIVGYRTMAPMLDIFGLADRHVARLPIATRGRPGHEKIASPAYLLERDVTIADVEVYPIEYLPWVQLPSPRFPIRLVRWVPRFMEQLGRESPHAVPPLEAYLNAYPPPATEPDRFACDLWFFEELYFSQHPAATRRAFLERLARDGHLNPAWIPFYEAAPNGTPPGWTAVSTIDFGALDRSGWVQVGSAFAAWPTTSLPPSQTLVGHRDGPLLDTFTELLRDSATGALQSPPFALRGEVMTVRVGGGRDRTHLAVLLVADGNILATATGCNTEILSRRAWDIRPFRGRTARLVVLDEATGSWGHLLVDDVVQWGPSR